MGPDEDELEEIDELFDEFEAEVNEEEAQKIDNQFNTIQPGVIHNVPMQ